MTRTLGAGEEGGLVAAHQRKFIALPIGARCGAVDEQGPAILRVVDEEEGTLTEDEFLEAESDEAEYVADVVDGPQERTSYSRIGFGPADPAFAGAEGARTQAAVTVAIAKKKGSNAVRVAHEVEKTIEELRTTTIPAGVEVRILNDFLGCLKHPKDEMKRLAEAGLIRCQDAAQVASRRGEFERALPDALWFQQQLAKVGFSLAFSGQFDEQTRNVLAAFQMKYRPARYDGLADAETAAILVVLNNIP